MQRLHRTAHRFIWLVVLLAAAVVFVVSIQVRPEVPTEASSGVGAPAEVG